MIPIAVSVPLLHKPRLYHVLTAFASPGDLDTYRYWEPTLADSSLEVKDKYLAPYLLLDHNKIPNIIKTLRENKSPMELSEILTLLTTISAAGQKQSISK